MRVLLIVIFMPSELCLTIYSLLFFGAVFKPDKEDDPPPAPLLPDAQIDIVSLSLPIDDDDDDIEPVVVMVKSDI